MAPLPKENLLEAISAHYPLVRVNSAKDGEALVIQDGQDYMILGNTVEDGDNSVQKQIEISHLLPDIFVPVLTSACTDKYTLFLCPRYSSSLLSFLVPDDDYLAIISDCIPSRWEGTWQEQCQVIIPSYLQEIIRKKIVRMHEEGFIHGSLRSDRIYLSMNDDEVKDVMFSGFGRTHFGKELMELEVLGKMERHFDIIDSESSISEERVHFLHGESSVQDRVQLIKYAEIEELSPIIYPDHLL